MENRQLFYFCNNNNLKMIKHFDLRRVSGAFILMLTIGILVLHKQAAAQNRGIFVPYSTVGFGLGTANYYGDLAPYRRPLSSTFKMIRWNIGGNYTRHFTPTLAARVSFTYARIAGDDFIMNKVISGNPGVSKTNSGG